MNEMYGSTNDTAQNMFTRGQARPLFNKILQKYKSLETKCAFTLCEGTDFTGVSSAFEFDFNADVANNLGTPVLVLVNGRGKTPEAIDEAVTVARKSFDEQGLHASGHGCQPGGPGNVTTKVERYLKKEVAKRGPCVGSAGRTHTW